MKDIFKGNLKDPKSAIIDLVLFAVVMTVCAIIFLFAALFYDNCEPSARVLIFILAVVSFFLAVFFPAGAIYFISRMTKYPRTSRMFFKDDAYVAKKSKKKGT